MQVPFTKEYNIPDEPSWQQSNTWVSSPKEKGTIAITLIRTKITGKLAIGFCMVTTSGSIGRSLRKKRTRTVPSDQQTQAARRKRSPGWGINTWAWVVNRYAPVSISRTTATLIHDILSFRRIQANRMVVTVVSLTRKPALIAFVKEIPIRAKQVPKPAWMPLAAYSFQNWDFCFAYRLMNSDLTLGKIKTTKIKKANIVEIKRNGKTWAPALNPNLVKIICSAQNVENIRTLKVGEEGDVFMRISPDMLRGKSVR